MRVCIDRSFLGTPTSLAVSPDGSCEWHSGDCDAHLHSRDWHPVPFEHLAQMSGLDPSRLELAPTAQSRAFSSLGVEPDRVAWAPALGRRRLSGRLREVVGAIQEVVCDTELARYGETYGIGQEFLRRLSRPAIDRALLEARLQEVGGDGSGGSLATFTPDRDGLAPPISYSRIATVTGRLTVERGPRILTLTREHRDVVRSAQGGSVLEVDFVSLEPRLALLESGATPPRDIYSSLGTELGLELPRSALKLAVISSLYGSSAAALVETLGSRAAARDLVERVGERFGVRRLVERLRDHLSDRGRLHNRYGRPLLDAREGDPDPRLVSHYIQSSAVDVALMGFSDLTSRVAHLGVRPIYVIHDAVLLDVPPGAEEDLRRECEKGIDLEVGHFELGVKRVS